MTVSQHVCSSFIISLRRVVTTTLIFCIISNLIPSAIAVPKLIFEDNFDTLNRSTWQHLITSWRGGQSQFQYYTNRTENR
jgi:hypothetical protein